MNLSVIYTSTDNQVLSILSFMINDFHSEFLSHCLHSASQYRLLLSFDTETNVTTVMEKDPAFIWGQRLPEFKPEYGKTKHTYTYTDNNTLTLLNLVLPPAGLFVIGLFLENIKRGQHLYTTIHFKRTIKSNIPFVF